MLSNQDNIQSTTFSCTPTIPVIGEWQQEAPVGSSRYLRPVLLKLHLRHTCMSSEHLLGALQEIVQIKNVSKYIKQNYMIFMVQLQKCK